MASGIAGYRRLAATGGVDPAVRRRRAAILMLAAVGLIVLRLAARVGDLVGTDLNGPFRNAGFDIFYNVLVLALFVESFRDQGRDRWSAWRHDHPKALAALLVGFLFQLWQVAGDVAQVLGDGDPLFTAAGAGVKGWAQVAIAIAVLAAMTGSFLKLSIGGDLVVDQAPLSVVSEAVINADTLSTLGRCERLKGNMADARMFYQLGLDAARESGDPACLARSLKHIAELQYVEGHYAEAIVTYKEMFDGTMPQWQDAVSGELRELAARAAQSGDPVRAAAIRWESLLRSGLVDPETLAACFEGTALHASNDDGGLRGARLRGVGEAIREAAAKRQQSWAAANPLYAVALLNGEVDPAVATRGREEGRRLSPDEAFRVVLDTRTIDLTDVSTG